ncbi:MAG: response regulator [Lachnospiraceae bacterium]|nr:response regulator [Lachnospiraceae bacterium]
MKLSKFLDELDEIVYITDAQTNQLVFLNRIGRKLLGKKDYKGKCCYKTLYGKEEVCSTCPRAQLEEDTYFVRKNETAIGGSCCTTKDKLLMYEGRLCQMEIQQIPKEIRQTKKKTRDKLTNLLLAGEGRCVIEQYLSEENGKDGMLFLVDVDQLWKINEMYGCFFGDEAIKEISKLILDRVSQEDVVARIGGDEILIYRGGISIKDAYAFGKEICQEVKELYQNEKQENVLSCSIGMMNSGLIKDYEELLKYAEFALEYVKRHQVGEVLYYIDMKEEIDESIQKSKYTPRQDYNEVRFGSKSKDTLLFVRKLLEKSKSLKTAMYMIMARIGREYGLRRIAIMEVDQDFLSNHVIIQWKRNEGMKQLPEKMPITENAFEVIKENFTKNEYFIVEHISMDADYNKEGDSVDCSLLICDLKEQNNMTNLMVYECEEAEAGWPEEICELLKEITNLIELYNRRESMNREIKEKSEFLSGISHEIRTPMNAIYGWTSIARKHTDDKHKVKEYLDKIDTSSKYLLSIMDEILDVENMENGRFEIIRERFSLSELYHQIEDLFCEQIQEKQMKLYFVNQSDCDCFLGDRKHLQQSIINILDYVIKNTENNSSVTLHSMQIGDLREEKVCFSIESTGKYGHSYELEQLKEMLGETETMFRTKLGDISLPLLISNRFIQSMGGQMEVGEVEGGLYLSFAIPLEAAKIIIEPKSDEERDYNFQGKRLLLVEDNLLNVEVAQTLLEMVGFEVDVAENGKVAVEKFDKNEDGSYDAILMDIRMPIMDGLEATRRIRNLGKKDSRTISIVALSANAHDEDAKKSIANGMNGHLAKPIEVSDLYRMLDQLIT